MEGNISSAGKAPWPVPKLNTSLSAAMEAAQASAARSMASSWRARISASRSISVAK